MYNLSEPQVTVIGIGNRNVGDDAIALVILDTIKDKVSNTVDVQRWEDKDALSITSELLEITTPIIIVDCADMGLKAGEYRFFKAEECSLSQHLQSVSTHGLGFSDALELAKTLGFEQALSIFAIQPDKLELSQSLSPVLEQKKEDISAALLHKLNEFAPIKKAKTRAQS